jgi:hypothetical protein
MSSCRVTDERFEDGKKLQIEKKRTVAAAITAVSALLGGFGNLNLR